MVLSLSALLCGFLKGDMTAVSAASLEGCNKAVELVIYLSGSMCLWGGLMKICEKAGITAVIAHMLSPVTRLLFRDAAHCPEVMNAVTMNLTANLLGLGNAATPSGIATVKAMQKLPPAARKKCISMLVVLNTASIQLIPSTIAAMRLEHGAVSPFDVTPAIIFSSLISVTAGCLMVYALKFSVLRLFLLPLLAYGISLAAGLDSVAAGVAVIMTGMPAGATAAIFAARYDSDAPFAAKTVVLTTLISMITIPAWCLFIG